MCPPKPAECIQQVRQGRPNLAGLGPKKTNLESEYNHCVRKNITLPVRAGFHSSTLNATDGLSVMVTEHV